MSSVPTPSPHNSSNPEKLLDVSALAELLGISVGTVYNLHRTGRLPRPFKLGGGDGLLRWHPEVVTLWLREQAGLLQTDPKPRRGRPRKTDDPIATLSRGGR